MVTSLPKTMGPQMFYCSNTVLQSISEINSLQVEDPSGGVLVVFPNSLPSLGFTVGRKNWPSGHSLWGLC